jgi:DNA-binding NtrC family response regulator
MRSDRPAKGKVCLLVVPQGAPHVREALRSAGHEVVEASGEREALAAMDRGAFAAAYVAQALGASSVGRLVAGAAPRLGDGPVVVLGESGSVQEAVDAMQLGADDYLAPGTPAEAIAQRLAAALARRVPATGSPTALMGIVGSSPAMRRLHATIDKISRHKSNVLLLGESGTGKELIARALHERGPRRQHQFVPVNCATLGREILENELFGHERGAFTGANERKKGLFELADGGTFFLDEIAEMDVATQAKLLRVLERGEFRRVGGTGKVKVDLSIVAATNRDLEEAIAAGRFREDLYWRLKVVTLVVPPLRERREDIPALVDAFIADFNRRAGASIAGVGRGVMQRLVDHDWPGNVRELRNAVEGACVLASGDLVTLDDFAELRPRRGAPRPADPPARGRAHAHVPEEAADAVAIPLGTRLDEAERRIVLAHLRHYRTRARTARALGIGLRTLYTKLAAWNREGVDAESA